MKKETLEEYLARGGKIDKVTVPKTSYVDRFAITTPRLKNNKEEYIKFIKKARERKNNENSGTN